MSPTKSLVIVESPHKATMIAGYLGPKYTVRASQGHVRDLPTSASEVPAKYGFRIDVANSLVKESGLPDLPENEKFGELVGDSPMWDQPELASIQRRWRAIADEYADTPEGPRMFVAEAYLPHDRLVRYLESDRLHTSFNFEFLISA